MLRMKQKPRSLDGIKNMKMYDKNNNYFLLKGKIKMSL